MRQQNWGEGRIEQASHRKARVTLEACVVTETVSAREARKKYFQCPDRKYLSAHDKNIGNRFAKLRAAKRHTQGGKQAKVERVCPQDFFNEEFKERPSDEGELADAKLLKHREKGRTGGKLKDGFTKLYFGEVEFTGEIKGPERPISGSNLAAFADDLGLFPRMHMVARNSS